MLLHLRQGLEWLIPAAKEAIDDRNILQPVHLLDFVRIFLTYLSWLPLHDSRKRSQLIFPSFAPFTFKHTLLSFHATELELTNDVWTFRWTLENGWTINSCVCVNLLVLYKVEIAINAIDEACKSVQKKGSRSMLKPGFVHPT